MSRYVLEIIKDQMRTPDVPEHVLMYRDDILFLLDIIEVAEEMALYTQHGEGNRVKIAMRLMDKWRELLQHEA